LLQFLDFDKIPPTKTIAILHNRFVVNNWSLAEIGRHYLQPPDTFPGLSETKYTKNAIPAFLQTHVLLMYLEPRERV